MAPRLQQRTAGSFEWPGPPQRVPAPAADIQKGVWYQKMLANWPLTVECVAKSIPQRGTFTANAQWRLLAQNASIDSRGHPARSEEHTSELQSRFDLVCRLLL